MTEVQKNWYILVSLLAGAVAFLSAWAYAVSTFGWFLGVGLGWIPALGIGAVVFLVWPLLVIGLGFLVLLARL